MLACVGCGPKGPEMGAVTGTVTLDGKPLSNAMVIFSPESGGRPGSGKTDASGKFEIYTMGSQGVAVGSCRVSVSTYVEPAAQAASVSSDSAEYANQTSQADYNAAKPPKDPIPEKYNVKTELREEVKSGAQVIDFELKT